MLALLEVRNSELFAWLRPNLTPWSHHDFERIKKFREGLLRRLPRSCTHLREKLHKKNSLSGGYRQPFQTGKIQKVALIIQSYHMIHMESSIYILGYTIPLDKRLAADGRGLQSSHINENFAKLSEALYIADRKAREAVEMRAQVERKIAVKEKVKS